MSTRQPTSLLVHRSTRFACCCLVVEELRGYSRTRAGVDGSSFFFELRCAPTHTRNESQSQMEPLWRVLLLCVFRGRYEYNRTELNCGCCIDYHLVDFFFYEYLIHYSTRFQLKHLVVSLIHVQLGSMGASLQRSAGDFHAGSTRLQSTYSTSSSQRVVTQENII